MLGLDLTLSYNGAPVVHGAEIHLEPGKVTALVGPNGSGKSTLLRALARLHQPDAGRVLLAADDGHTISEAEAVPGAGPAELLDHGIDAATLSGRDFARRVTLLAQSRPTPGGITVRELVEFGRHPHRGRWIAGDAGGAGIVSRAMELTGVTAFADQPVDRLSGGQLQRVWLASCLAQDTGVLLLDEPTTYLDLRYQVELLDLIRELADEHGVTIGVVLHDLDQAAAVADRVVLLESGRVRAVGTPAEVLVSDVLSSAYGIRVDVEVDDRGCITTCPIGRYNTRARTERLVVA
ncbi:ABC transporter ATP-binding protein [Agromyces badenianii]|uniref:ABC transporter ATP-binding protein n=1 Tax=Agromyces badenianii TaxID=2080742 RepID=UPI000D58F743|nr:ABC transporter ATP-binding protein [Agromyces badenianii]PWC03112.1 Fe(3+)-dicitrate ABC transporter ATP-binding protein [Agromyces badenianii]